MRSRSAAPSVQHEEWRRSSQIFVTCNLWRVRERTGKEGSEQRVWGGERIIVTSRRATMEKEEGEAGYQCWPNRRFEQGRYSKAQLVVRQKEIDNEASGLARDREGGTHGEISWRTLSGRSLVRTETMTGSSRNVFWTTGTSCLKPTSADAKTIVGMNEMKRVNEMRFGMVKKKKGREERTWRRRRSKRVQKGNVTLSGSRIADEAIKAGANRERRSFEA